MYEHLSPFREDIFRLPDYCTVFQAEILAIKQAATDLCDGSMEKFKFVRFFIASQAALWALSKISITSKLVMETIQALCKVAAGRHIVLNWTPAHVGIAGNEKADELAKAGAVCDLSLIHI